MYYVFPIVTFSGAGDKNSPFVYVKVLQNFSAKPFFMTMKSSRSMLSIVYVKQSIPLYITRNGWPMPSAAILTFCQKLS